ncbi:MAG: DUF433 domain-containing protein [Pseudomonadota bacterium]
MFSSGKKFVGKGVYTIPEATRLTGAGYETMRRWLLGYSYKYKGKFVEKPPIFEAEFGKIDGELIISFQDLIELLFVVRFRSKKVKWGVIHEAFDKAKERFESNHPFSRLNYRTDGKRIFEDGESEKGRQFTDLNTDQIVFADFIDRTLSKGIEFSNREASIWFPKFPSKIIVLDPKRSFGRPIISRTGVPTEVIFAAYEADEDYSLVARDFDIRIQEVQSAVKFQQRLAA